MRTQIKRLHLAFHGTSVYVTHDQTEAMTLADRIIALRDGNIEQVGSPDDLYARPANRFIAGFIGSPTMNFLDAKLVADADGLAVVPTGGPALKVPAALVDRYRAHAGQDVVLGIRPEDSTNTWSEERGSNEAAVPVDLTVEITEPLGSEKLVFSRLGKGEVIARVISASTPTPGTVLRLHAHMDHMHLFDPASGRRSERPLQNGTEARLERLCMKIWLLSEVWPIYIKGLRLVRPRSQVRPKRRGIRTVPFAEVSRRRPQALPRGCRPAADAPRRYRIAGSRNPFSRAQSRAIS